MNEIPTEVRTYLEGILQDAGMTSLDPQMHEEMLKELYARLDNHLTSVIAQNMPAPHLEEFIKMNEEGKGKPEIEAFVKEKMPNAQEILAQAFSEFRDLYLGNVQVARGGAS